MTCSPRPDISKPWPCWKKSARSAAGRPARLPALVLLIVAAVALGGCGRRVDYPLPADGISRFPTGEPLEEGDVLLARSYGLIGAMFANWSQAGGKYSHGAMVYRADNGRLMMLNYRPTGMETCTPEEFFTRYNRLALIRYNCSLDAACAPDYVPNGAGLRGKAALSATSRYWLWKNDQQRIPPDYHLDHDEHSAMFCLELTSTVYRDCGLPDPFFRARKADEDPLLTTANQLFKADVYEIRSPSSALENPEFHLVDDWIRPEYDLREEALNEELMRVAVADIEGGLRPKRPKFLGRMKLRQVFILYHIVTTTMFWRPKQDLPDFIDTEVIHNAYMLYSYVAKSKKLAKARMERETGPVFIADAEDHREATLSAVRRIVREATDCFRDKYMELKACPFHSALDVPTDPPLPVGTEARPGE
ncbi:MAG: hypothetical protein LIP77_06000 [Planctomycetes bacterium]|nr:hypothetical protein [Planctomycetota bacterium]